VRIANIASRLAALAAACVAANIGTALAQSASDPSEENAQLYRDYRKSHPYLYDAFSAGADGTSGIDELDEISRPEIPVADTAKFDSPLSFARGKFDALYAKTGLRLGVAYTALGAWASGEGKTNGAAGDLDLMSAWTLLGRGTPNTGELVATVEYRHEITDQPPSALGGELGTLINVTNAFNNRGWVVRDFYWLQRLYEGKLRVFAGRADMGDFVGSQPMQNVNSQFVNRHFSSNPTVPFPGHGPTVGLSVRPDDRFYVTAGVANAYNTTTDSEFRSIDYGDFFYSVEAGFTPYVEGRGRGRYSIMGWHIDERTRDSVIPSGQGFTLVASQEMSDRFQLWARYCHAEGTSNNVRQVAQGGLGYRGLFGSPSNMTGLAVSFAQPRSAASRNESVAEVFERLQLTRFIQLSAGAQAIFNPGNNPDKNLIGVVYARLRIAF
jgi:porin